MYGPATVCYIGAPISANQMYAMTPKGVFITKKYWQWIDKNVPLVQTAMRPAQTFPISIAITIVQGCGTVAKNLEKSTKMW